MEGKLESCLRSKCYNSCCERGYSESIEEYQNSFREKNREVLESQGIIVEIKDDLVLYKGCSDGKNCKVLEYFGDGEDVRSLTCKIYPYLHQWLNVGGREYIGIQLMPCPATKPNHSVPKSFTEEVITLIKKEYMKLQNKKVEVVVVNPILII